MDFVQNSSKDETKLIVKAILNFKVKFMILNCKFGRSIRILKTKRQQDYCEFSEIEREKFNLT